MLTTTDVKGTVKLASKFAEHRHWYARANDELRALFGHAAGYVADILAITCPKCPVWINVVRTMAFMEHGLEGVEGKVKTARVSSGISASLRHYIATGEIRGPKTSAFARNLRGDYGPVTVDVHMYWVYGCGERASVRERREIVATVESAAKVLGWEPAEVQAALWAAAMDAKGRTDVPDMAVLLREYVKLAKV